MQVFRTDLRTDRHACRYRTRPHQIMMGCGCFCDLCSHGVDSSVGRAPVIAEVGGSNPSPPQSDEMKTPSEWEVATGIRIHDPDGWRGRMAKSWQEPLSRDDFINRAKVSTCSGWRDFDKVSVTEQDRPSPTDSSED